MLVLVHSSRTRNMAGGAEQSIEQGPVRMEITPSLCASASFLRFPVHTGAVIAAGCVVSCCTNEPSTRRAKHLLPLSKGCAVRMIRSPPLRPNAPSSTPVHEYTTCANRPSLAEAAQGQLVLRPKYQHIWRLLLKTLN